MLAATDLTEDSEPALRAAFEVAGAFGGNVIAVHVAAADAGPEALVRARRDLQSQVHRVRESASGRPPTTEIVVAGEPPLSILGAAEEHRADLIVIGTHGRIGRLRGLIGSVAEQVVRLARCAVLTVHGPS
ncbi:MAG: universal stress protein [Deltaproteobacteria bacterium]|nr:universal stress protein [Deltaproteobacteria bacterium]